MKCGKKVCFHGAFASKHSAKIKEREVGGFIQRIKVRGHERYVVMTGKPTKKYRSELHG